MDKKQKRLSLTAIKQKLLFMPKICEVRQVYIKKEAITLYKLFNNKIHRASKEIKKNFMYNNIYEMLIYLEIALLNHSHKGYYKYNLFSLLCNPCFLLYIHYLLKKEKPNNNDTNIGKFRLSTILSLSTKIALKTYIPKPIHKIFISKADGKMRPLGISSDYDKVLQKAIIIFLEPIFEKKFLKCSHSFLKKKNCHSCLSQIYYNWTGTK